MGVAYAFADRKIAPYIGAMKELGIVAAPARISVVPVSSLKGPYLGTAREAQAAGIRDVIEINFEGVPHKTVKLEAERLLNQGYQSDAYQDGQPLKGGTVHVERGRPVADIGTFIPGYRN